MNHGEQVDSPRLRPELVASWRETFIVLFTFTGYFLTSSLLMGVDRAQGNPPWFSDSTRSMLRTCSLESVMLAALLAFLFHRGWRLEDLRIRRGWISSLQGTLLLVAWLVLAFGMFLLDWRWTHASAGGHLEPFHHLKHNLSWTVMVLTQVVNAYYEEITMTTYAFNQFAAKCGPWVALALTVLLRMSFHLWKDPVMLALTAGHFLLAVLLYWRTRNLWPLILCHASFDILFYSRSVTEM